MSRRSVQVPRAARRQLLGSLSSMLLLSATEAGAAKAQELDGELLAAVAALRRAGVELDRVNNRRLGPDVSANDPQSLGLDAEVDAANAAWAQAAFALADCSPRTPEGLHAMLGAAHAAFEQEGGRHLSYAALELIGATLAAAGEA